MTQRITNKLPNIIVEHLDSINAKKIFDREYNAYLNLAKTASPSSISAAVDSLLRNGVPPYGKLCLHPLTALLEKPSLLELFSNETETSKGELKDISPSSQTTLEI